MTRTALIALAFIIAPGLAAAQTQAQEQPQAPERMSRRALNEEVTQLRRIVQGRAVRPQRPEGCASAESRQFDFWLGEWDVSPSGASVTVAESAITLHDQGCVIIEHWRPFGGAHGHSINIYDANEGRWRQTWADATGRRTEYAGALDGEVLRFDDVSGTGPGAQEGVRGRMNFQRIDADTVRQWGENFDAASNAWTVTWDLTYRRRAGTR